MTLTSCLCSIVYNAWYFYRDLITFVATFGRKNYAGQNIRILGKRAVKYFYGGDTACGGCTHGFPCIYIFMHDSRLSNPEDAIADIITHETLHQVIFLIGERRSRWDGWDGLDNIHFLRWKSFGGNKLPEIYADFVGEGKWDKYKIHGGLLKQPSI